MITPLDADTLYFNVNASTHTKTYGATSGEKSGEGVH